MTSGKHGRRRPPRRPFGGAPRQPPRAVAAAGPRASGPASQAWAATGSRAIFRKEALEFHVRGRDLAGGVVRLGGRWLRWLYRLTIALVIAGAAGVALVPARQSSYGPAVIAAGGGRFAALFPAGVAPDLAAARGLSFVLPGAGLRPAGVAGLRVKLATASAARRTGLAAPHQPSILLTGRLLTEVRAGGPGPVRAVAVVVLPARPLAAVLGREVTVMLGRARAGS